MITKASCWSALPLAVLCLLSSCGRQGATSQVPTTTEVFHLRSECAVLGRKILSDNPDPGIGVVRVEKMLTHYDSKTNRCYVELMRGSTETDHRLYDGQTGEVLASTHMWSGNPVVLSSGAKPELLTLPIEDKASYQAVEVFIRKMMADDEKR
jgi:hypothetical protein